MGAKLYWAKEITTYGKTIIITMYDWVCNINKCNCITIMPQKGKKEIEEYRSNDSIISLELN